MRVLLVSDLHYCLPQWDWVVRAVAVLKEQTRLLSEAGKPSPGRP